MSSSACAPESAASLVRGYRSAPAGFDELVDGAGGVRPHWSPLLRALDGLGADMRAQRAQQINAKVRETGIAYDLFADPMATVQPWRVDLVPLVFAADEWRWLEQALLQRARLVEALLTDLYGPQRLLASGAIPHQLVFSDPSFLRACRDLRPPGGHLQFLAVDVARGPDGRWRAIDTHAETPAGIGYALANRMVHTSVAGDVFAACKVVRQAPFFERMQSALLQRADRVDPIIALLTPGPRHGDFFSHAYLARYLGLSLVEGGDLHVSGGRVALKTLHGLTPVDLIVRCIAGASADPLELDGRDFDGPVGLLQVVRRHPGLVTNTLGVAVAENRGLGTHLPQLARLLLGEELRLADGERWWLGDAANRAHVAANLERVVIRPAHEGTARPGQAVAGIDPARLRRAEIAALLERIEIDGAGLVAEAKAGLGTTPSLGPGGLVPRPYALRLFVTATADGGFAVLPGGLAMTVDPDRTVALSAPDGESRDVWVVSDAPPAPFTSLWRPTIDAARRHRAVTEDLPSRAAETLYWLGRYAERADWTLRVLRICLGRLQEDGEARQYARPCMVAMEALLPGAGRTLAGRWEPASAGAIEQLARSLMASPDEPWGLPRTLDNIHRTAGLVRDRLSAEAWRTLNGFYAGRRWRTDAMPAGRSDALRLIDDGLQVLAAFNGLAHESFTRNYGWTFLDLGRRLARTHSLAGLLRGVFVPAGEDETGSLLFTLELADSFIAYRSRYRLEPMLPLLLDLLLVDESNPRGIAFQLAQIERHIDSLPQSGAGGSRTPEQRLVLSLLTDVRLADVAALAAGDPGGTRGELHTLLDRQVSALGDLADAIGRRYFDLVEKGVKWVRTSPRGAP